MRDPARGNHISAKIFTKSHLNHMRFYIIFDPIEEREPARMHGGSGKKVASRHNAFKLFLNEHSYTNQNAAVFSQIFKPITCNFNI